MCVGAVFTASFCKRDFLAGALVFVVRVVGGVFCAATTFWVVVLVGVVCATRDEAAIKSDKVICIRDSYDFIPQSRGIYDEKVLCLSSTSGFCTASTESESAELCAIALAKGVAGGVITSAFFVPRAVLTAETV